MIGIDKMRAVVYNTIMKKIIGLIALCFASLTFAQSADWNLSEVKGKDNMPVGYIYHNYSVGTQTGATTEKVVTGLRLICSISPRAVPIVAVFWDGTLSTEAPQHLIWSVDGKTVVTGTWRQEDHIIYRMTSETMALVNALRTGHVAIVSWTGVDAVRRNTAFNVTDFEAHLKDFNTACKI